MADQVQQEQMPISTSREHGTVQSPKSLTWPSPRLAVEPQSQPQALRLKKSKSWPITGHDPASGQTSFQNAQSRSSSLYVEVGNHRPPESRNTSGCKRAFNTSEDELVGGTGSQFDPESQRKHLKIDRDSDEMSGGHRTDNSQ